MGTRINSSGIAALLGTVIAFSCFCGAQKETGGHTELYRKLASANTGSDTGTAVDLLSGMKPESHVDILSAARNDSTFRADAWLAQDHRYTVSIQKRRISSYDRIIKKMARRYGFDWRLIAAQIYVESHFSERARSRVGARGLMQIMPRTARYLGINPAHLDKPAVNIATGCRYDQRLYSQWKKQARGPTRLAFALASYNAGRGRILRSFSREKGRITWSTVYPHVPRETRQYVHKIYLKYDRYSSHFLP